MLNARGHCCATLTGTARYYNNNNNNEEDFPNNGLTMLNGIQMIDVKRDYLVAIHRQHTFNCLWLIVIHSTLT